MWFDEFGIFNSVTKPNSEISKQNLIATFNYIKAKSNGKKVCWLSDISQAAAPTKEGRDFAAEETPKIVKALALITNSALSRAMAEIYLLVKKPPYPIKMFTDEARAKAWIIDMCASDEMRDLAG
jgi:hypothetical protein